MSSAPLVRRNEWHRFADQVESIEVTKSVSVVVPCRNPGIGLHRLIDSIEAQQRLHDCDIEVVVVDDNSTDPIEFEPRGELPVRVVRLDPHGVFGAGMARNAGAKVAQGDVLLFLDADMLLGPLAIQHLVRWFEVVDFAAVTGVLSFVSDEELDAAFGIEPVDLEALAARGTDDQAWRSKHFTRSFDMTSDRSDLYRTTIGACIAVTRAFHGAVGGFRELGVRGIEDIEYGHRLHNAGALMVLERDATLIHQGERSFDSARAAEIRRVREPFMLDLLPGRRLERRRDEPNTRQVPSVVIDCGQLPAASMALGTLVATKTQDVVFVDAELVDSRCVDRGFLATIDGASAPYHLTIVDPDAAFPADAIESLIALMEAEALGSIHIVGEETQMIGTMHWARATNRADLVGVSEPEDVFGVRWIRLGSLAADA